MQHERSSLAWVAIDFLSCLILVVYVLIAPPVEKHKPTIETLGSYAIVLTWPDNLNVDIDLYVESPDGDLVWFAQGTSAGMHLERDDLGKIHDDGKTNGERVVIRSVVRGEYAASAHGYRAGGEVPVTATLYKIAGEDARVYTRSFSVRPKEEETAFRFSLNANGMVRDVNTLPKRLVVATP